MSDERKAALKVVESNTAAGKFRAREFFGAVAVRLGIVRSEDVARALTEQQARVERGARRQRLGTLMREMGIISAQQLSRVLVQMESGRVLLSEDGISVAARLRATATRERVVIAISSVDAADGSATAVAQLGTSLALMEQGSVIVVDANLRGPQLHNVFSTDLTPGLTEVVSDSMPLAQAIRTNDASGLHVLPAGNVALDILAMLMSQEFADTLNALRKMYRWVLLDTTPTHEHPDAILVFARADGVLVTLAAGLRRKSELLEIKRTIDGVGVPIIGVILTEPAEHRVSSGRRMRRLWSQYVQR